METNIQPRTKQTTQQKTIPDWNMHSFLFLFSIVQQISQVFPSKSALCSQVCFSCVVLLLAIVFLLIRFVWIYYLIYFVFIASIFFMMKRKTDPTEDSIPETNLRGFWSSCVNCFSKYFLQTLPWAAISVFVYWILGWVCVCVFHCSYCSVVFCVSWFLWSRFHAFLRKQHLCGHSVS